MVRLTEMKRSAIDQNRSEKDKKECGSQNEADRKRRPTLHGSMRLHGNGSLYDARSVVKHSRWCKGARYNATASTGVRSC
jgi:Ni/Co efflux regulator RcnB